MTCDAVTLGALSLPSPLYKDNQADLKVTMNTTASGVAEDVNSAELLLLFSTFGTGALKAVKNKYTMAHSTTGVYTYTIPAADFQEPGVYQLQGKGVETSGGVIVAAPSALSAEFRVVDLNGADKNNVMTDAEFAKIHAAASPVWKTVTLTGAQIKAGVADNTQQTSLMKIDTLPAGAVLVGGIVKVNDAIAITGAKMNLGAGSSSNNLVATAAADSTATTGVSASFVPVLAGSTDMNIKPDAASGHTISEFADADSVSFTFGYVVPYVFNLAS